MALVTIKSGVITNRDSSPQVKTNSNLGGMLKEAVGTLEATVADDIGSKYVFCSIPSNARVSQVLLYADDQGIVGDLDIGLYKTTADGGAEVDADFFASAVDVNAAALNAVDVTHESGVFGLEDAEKMVWQALGLTSDPGLIYDVVGTLTEANSAGASILVKVRYSV